MLLYLLAVSGLLSIMNSHVTATPTGNHTCTGVVKHPVTVRVNVTEPVTYRTYTWCLRVPPRCSKYTVELKDRVKIHTEMHNRTITVCCKGYVEMEFKCVPACPPQQECPNMHCNRTNHCYCTPGYQGLYCNYPCDRGFWGTDCKKPCDCPDGYICHHLTGDCMLDDKPPTKLRRTTTTTALNAETSTADWRTSISQPLTTSSQLTTDRATTLSTTVSTSASTASSASKTTANAGVHTSTTAGSSPYSTSTLSTPDRSFTTTYPPTVATDSRASTKNYISTSKLPLSTMSPSLMPTTLATTTITSTMTTSTSTTPETSTELSAKDTSVPHRINTTPFIEKPAMQPQLESSTTISTTTTLFLPVDATATQFNESYVMVTYSTANIPPTVAEIPHNSMNSTKQYDTHLPSFSTTEPTKFDLPKENTEIASTTTIPATTVTAATTKTTITQERPVPQEVITEQPTQTMKPSAKMPVVPSPEGTTTVTTPETRSTSNKHFMTTTENISDDHTATHSSNKTLVSKVWSTEMTTTMSEKRDHLDSSVNETMVETLNTSLSPLTEDDKNASTKSGLQLTSPEIPYTRSHISAETQSSASNLPTQDLSVIKPTGVAVSLTTESNGKEIRTSFSSYREKSVTNVTGSHPEKSTASDTQKTSTATVLDSFIGLSENVTSPSILNRNENNSSVDLEIKKYESILTELSILGGKMSEKIDNTWGPVPSPNTTVSHTKPALSENDSVIESIFDSRFDVSEKTTTNFIKKTHTNLSNSLAALNEVSTRFDPPYFDLGNSVSEGKEATTTAPREETTTKSSWPTTDPRPAHTWYSHVKDQNKKGRSKEDARAVKTSPFMDVLAVTEKYDLSEESNNIDSMQTTFTERVLKNNVVASPINDEEEVNIDTYRQHGRFNISSATAEGVQAERSSLFSLYSTATIVAGVALVLLISTTVVLWVCLRKKKEQTTLLGPCIMAYGPPTQHTLNPLIYETVFPLEVEQCSEAEVFFCPKFTNNYAEMINRELSQLSYDQPRSTRCEPLYAEIRY